MENLDPFDIALEQLNKAAKVDYAKNIKIYTSIPQANVQIYIETLYSVGLIEKYMGSSVKRTQAKLKKTNEVHKHHL